MEFVSLSLLVSTLAWLTECKVIKVWLTSSVAYRSRANSGKPLPEGTAEEIKVARIYRRFYAAFQLRDLCNEIPIHTVARKYEIPRGLVQTLAQTCEGFAAGMISFCNRMEWGMLKSVLEHMVCQLGVNIPSPSRACFHLSYPRNSSRSSGYSPKK